MRRELILVFVAISTMIVVAFVVPLGLSARATARDRAMDGARAESATLVPLVATGDHQAIMTEVDSVNATGELAVTVVLADETEIGSAVIDRVRLETVLREVTSLTGQTTGGREVVTAVALPDGQAAVRVFVPDDELNRGVVAAWATLAGLGATLVLLAVALADRIAQRVIRPAVELSDAATSLGGGRFDVRVEPSGPPELVATARAFNTLVGRVETMLADERAMVAELTHRLRTPLTRLRIGLDQVEDPQVAGQLHADIDALAAEVDGLISQARHNLDPPALVDVGEVASQRFEFWSVLAAEEQRQCTLDRRSPMHIAINNDELEAALDVLIENIFAHTPIGTPFAVSVVASADGGGSLIIEDGGSGFDPTLVPAGQSGTGSTGLGLAIVERLTEQCGGTLTVTDSDLGGARVECRFPGPGPSPTELM